MDITAKVIGQSIIMPVNTRGMIAKAEDYVRFVFIMSKEWDDLTVMAQFQQFGNTYDVYLDDEGVQSCRVVSSMVLVLLLCLALVVILSLRLARQKSLSRRIMKMKNEVIEWT